MPKFKCQNIRCSKYEQEINVHKVSWKFDEVQKKLILVKKFYCDECNLELHYVKQEGPINCTLLKFDSMSPEQKRESLRKRNRDHYEKFEKKDVEQKRKQILSDNRKQFGLK